MPANVYPVLQPIPLAKARQIVDGALAFAASREMNPITVTVLDLGGNTITCDRTDGCAMMRIAVAHGKAKAALGYGISSRDIGARNEERPAFLAAVAAASDGEFIPVPGGVLVLDDDDRVIGAVGISGDSSENDEQAALKGITQAGLRAGFSP